MRRLLSSLGICALAASSIVAVRPAEHVAAANSVCPGAGATLGLGGQILVVASATNGFSCYFGELLLAEGYTGFEIRTAAAITSPLLSTKKVVIVGDVPLSAAQVGLLRSWSGSTCGTVVLTRPSPSNADLMNLAGLASGPAFARAPRYVQIVDRVVGAAGVGLPSRPLVFHGPVVSYRRLTGTRLIAQFNLDGGTPLSQPALVSRRLGATGCGLVATFAYDLPRSVVLSRQGNPAWANQRRLRPQNLVEPVRPLDMFVEKMAVPDVGANVVGWNTPPDQAVPVAQAMALAQADEQVRLLTHLFEKPDRFPLPRTWYLPSEGEVTTGTAPPLRKLVVVMTADDHEPAYGTSRTLDRFRMLASFDPTNCSVQKWTCFRSSSFIYPGNRWAAGGNAALFAQREQEAANLVAAGFDVGLHATATTDRNNCGNFAQSTITSRISADVGLLKSEHTRVFTAPRTPTAMRTHCVGWLGYVNVPVAARTSGIRADTSYWHVAGAISGSNEGDPPGYFTASALPLRFAQSNGHLIDSYQITTQVSDEYSPAKVRSVIAALLDTKVVNAVPEGTIGVIGVLIHSDEPLTTTDQAAKARAIVEAAHARGVSVISVKQLLDWTAARNAIRYTSIQQTGSVVSFEIPNAAVPPGVRTMIPLNSSLGRVNTIRDSAGRDVPFTTERVRGIEYLLFTPSPGSYSVAYTR